MLGNSSFNRSVDLLHRGMNVAWMRQDVISNNLANAEVPNFKAQSVSYESFLRRAIDSEKQPWFSQNLTNEKHIQARRPTDYRTIRPRVTTDYLSTMKNNGNNVDVEKETLHLVKNQMSYELMTQAINHKFRMVKSVFA